MDYAKLKAEIVKAAYAGLSDEAVAAALNAKTLAGPMRTLTNKEYLDALGQGTIQKAKETAEDPNAQGHAAALTVDEYRMTVGQVEVAPGTPCRLALDVLVTKNVIPAAELAAMVAKATPTISIGESLKFSREVNGGDVAWVRREMNG